jgi:hypothetical protein
MRPAGARGVKGCSYRWVRSLPLASQPAIGIRPSGTTGGGAIFLAMPEAGGASNVALTAVNFAGQFSSIDIAHKRIKTAIVTRG